MLEPDEAVQRILDALAPWAPLPPERVALAEAPGRALAEDLVAVAPLPPFDASQMDGYALRASDAPRAGARLPVAFEVFAGGAPPPALPPGACCRVFTGAPLPEGADCVEMQEEVRRRGRAATFRRPAEAGRFRRRAGSDVAAGAVALPAGAVIDAGGVALAAAVGRAELAVRRRPRVGVLVTGDELVPAGRAPGPGQLPDSNGPMLAAACREAGAVPVLLPLAGDRPEALDAALAAAEGLDALVTTGGVSVGARDLVRAALARAGTRLDFWRVAMRPGKPVAFGLRGRTAVFGLPGNPASALVTFELFVRPALRALAGLPGTGRLTLEARLDTAVTKPAGLTVYLRVRLERTRGGLRAVPLRTQASGDLSSIAGVHGLAVLPAGVPRVTRGGRTHIILLTPPPSC